MVQMKVTAAALVAAAAIAPAVASYYSEDSLAARDYNEVDEILARDYDLELEERDFYDNEDDLFERDPFFGFNHLKRLWRTKKTLQPQYGTDAPVEAREFDDDELMTRELEEMFTRDPFLGFGIVKKWWKGRKAAKQQQQMQQDDSSVQAREFDDEDSLFIRELEDMFERDPFLGLGKLKAWWKNRKAAKQQQQQFQDTYADPQAREFDDDDLYTREYEDEIEAREPEADYEEVLSRYYDDLYERELAVAEAELAERDFEDEEAELAAREFDDEDSELLAREPNIIDWFKNLFHPKKKEDAKPKAADPPADSAEAREFDDIDELD